MASASTIFALSSGAPPAGVAVVRISGPTAFAALEQVTSRPLPPPRQVTLRSVVDGEGNILDQALVLTFRAPSSFTGEDCVELQLHGSRAVVAAVLKLLSQIDDLREAEAGEFTRRAFENGRIDLVEAEGLAELISAETEMQRRLAVEQSFGGQSALYQDWARRMTYARAMIEADLDFADEDDVPGSVAAESVQDLVALRHEIDEHLLGARAGEVIRNGYKIAIVGAPNAGKSSLLNALAQRDVAIVTEIAGTTRDVIQVDLDMEGFLVRLFDTAGLRETEDVVEREGVRRAIATSETADLILHLQEIDSLPQQSASLPSVETLLIGSKLDIHPRSPSYDLCLSAKSGQGLEELRNVILTRLRKRWVGALVPTRKRQIDLLSLASHNIENAIDAQALEVRAEHLRAAGDAIGRITGHVDVEQLLDVIFSQFCIGK